MDEATIEDLAFVVLSLREVDETWRGNSFAFPLPTVASFHEAPCLPFSVRYKPYLRPRGNIPLEPHRFAASRNSVDLRVCLNEVSYAAAEKAERRMALKI